MNDCGHTKVNPFPGFADCWTKNCYTRRILAHNAQLRGIRAYVPNINHTTKERLRFSLPTRPGQWRRNGKVLPPESNSRSARTHDR
jgi:hypothetical protein